VATSIADLLTALDQATQCAPIGAGDGSRALQHAGRILNTLQVEGLGRDYPPRCAAAIRRLAESSADVAAALAQRAGHIGDLVGVLGDAVGTLRRELADTDRWTIAVLLAPIMRRCAHAIRDSGPYADVPELLGVLDRAAELQHTAAVTPPDPNRVRGLDAAIPTTWRRTGLSADAAVLDATATLAAEFRRRERPPATVRELIAVCHVASHVAERLAVGDPAGEVPPAEIWTQARNTLTQYTDGIPLPPPGQPRSNLLLQAMRVEAAVQRADAVRGTASSSGRQRSLATDAQRQLQRLASACHAELGRIGPTLTVVPGRRPLSDQRVAEWLRREPFRATSPDIVPALDTLRAAAIALDARRRHPAARRVAGKGIGIAF
jgi:hypothetical protein